MRMADEMDLPVYGALDLAKVSGAIVGRAFGTPTCETWDLSKGGHYVNRGDRGCVLASKLAIWLQRHRPVLVFIEEPMDVQSAVRMGSEQATTIALNGYVFLAETVCAKYGVATKLIDRQDALRHFTGQPRYKEKGAAKRACQVRCKQLGYPITTPDEADACAIWDLGCAHEHPRAYALANVNAPMRMANDEKIGTPRRKAGPRARRARPGLPLFR